MMQTPSTQTTEHTSSCLQTSRWYHAMTLEERTATPLYPEQQHTGSEQAIKKLRRWKEQAPFDKGEFFANRLAVDYITEQDLLALLDESMEALQERLSQTSTPDWLIELARNLETDSSIATIAQVFGGTEGTSGTYALLQPFYVLLQSGIERFQAGVAGITAQHTDLPFRSEDLLALLLPNLARQMIPKLSRAVVLELHIARLRGQLLGDTSQERFSYYLQRLSQPEHLRAFLEEYCILARQLMMTIHLWVHCNLEFIRHLCADWQQILATFTPEQELGTLTEVAGGAGDTHRNGHSVMILTFHSGWRLVYKPRALGVDIHFQSLLTWLNARGNHPAFCTLKLINKGDYGWVEFAPDVECTSEEEIRRFYERQGGYLALLYALDAMDFHAENIIAAGEHPLLIDLEALFHPRVQTKYTAELDRPGWDTLTHSVMQIALLPQRIWSNAEFEGIDISGLGKMEGQLSPLPMPQWESIGSDEMKIVRERVKMAGSKNCPKLCGQPVQALDYIESIIKGFTSIYRLLVEKRSELVTSILPQFAHDEIRFIARATRTYALLLNESFHPNMLRDALKRERHFDHLWAAVEQQPYLQRLISAERADLCRGDIPLFTTYPDSRNIFTSQRERIAEFFSEPSIERVNRHLYQLGEEDMRRQIWMIHAAFTSTATEPAPASSSLLPSHHSPEPVHGEQLLLEARAIGDRLCELALWDNGGADWIGLTCVNERDWSIALAGVDLYSGLPGMILFLSHLGANTGEARYTLCARAALKTLHGIIQYMTTATELPGVGAFNGIGSCIYTFSHLAVLWDEPSLLQKAQELVQLLPAWITKDKQFDIVDGSAGCIASLLTLHSLLPSPLTLTGAMQCGDHLLACAQSLDIGIGWKTPQQSKPLTGFSHGTAGIVRSLLQLAEMSGEERFKRAALAALAYERSLFSHEKRNWLDLRKTPQTKEEQAPRAGMSWSHGAPGIALARLTSLRYMDDETTRYEIETALTTLLEEGIGYHHELIGPNHSLAHGDFGNLETLLLAAQILDTPQLHKDRERLTAQLIAGLHQHGRIMGVPLNVETPGFMIGLAGIGYELLRLAEPESIPSILALAPPAIRKGA